MRFWDDKGINLLDYWYVCPEELDYSHRTPQGNLMRAQVVREASVLTSNHYNVVGYAHPMLLSIDLGQKYWPEPSFDSLTLQEYPGYYNPRGYYRS